MSDGEITKKNTLWPQKQSHKQHLSEHFKPKLNRNHFRQISTFKWMNNVQPANVKCIICLIRLSTLSKC